MGTIEMIRQDPLPETNSSSNLATRLAGLPAEERVVELLAFALAAEAGAAPVAEPAAAAMTQHRHAAMTVLSEHAFRYLHNTIEQIRRDAVAEHLGKLRRPPGFARLVFANLVALGIGGLLAAWIALHPATFAGLAGYLAG
jgi:hypothetical protein